MFCTIRNRAVSHKLHDFVGTGDRIRTNDTGYEIPNLGANFGKLSYYITHDFNGICSIMCTKICTEYFFGQNGVLTALKMDYRTEKVRCRNNPAPCKTFFTTVLIHLETCAEFGSG